MSGAMDGVRAIGLARARRAAADLTEATVQAADATPGVRAERADGAVRLVGRRGPVRAAVELVRSLRGRA